MLLLEQTAIAPDLTTVTLTAGTGSAYMTRPSESPPNVVYPARLTTAFSHARYCWSQNATTGRTMISSGTFEFANGDGALDPWVLYGVDGQPFVLRRGADAVGETGVYPDDYPVLFAGLAAGFAPTWSSLVLNTTDALGLALDLPLQQTLYKGTNVGSAGIEGLSTDLYNQPKPKLRGWVQNIQPVLVNSQALLYQVDDGTAVSPMGLTVYVGGLPVTAGKQQASLAAMIALYPAWSAGQVTLTGAYCTNSSKVYVCTAPGTTAASGGPTGTAASITDGTVTWAYQGAAPAAQIVTFGNWAASAIATLNVHCLNGGNLYVCSTAGTTAASGGPSGTTTGIADGTAKWDYVGANTAITGPVQQWAPSSQVTTQLLAVNGPNVYRVTTTGTTGTSGGPTGTGTGIADGTAVWNYFAVANTNAFYDWYAGPEGWFFKMSFTAGLQITCDVSEGAATDRTIAQIAYRVLSNEGGIPASTIQGMAALDSALSGEVGVWSNQQTTAGAFLDPVLASGNAFMTDTMLGGVQLGTLLDPETQTSVASFQEWQIFGQANGLNIAFSQDQGVGLRVGTVGLDGHVTDASYANQGTSSGLPVWRVLVDYAQNHSIQNQTSVPALAASNAPRAAMLVQSCATASYSDSTGLIQRMHLKAPEFGIQTVFRYKTDALNEAQRQFNMRSRVNVIVQVPLRPDDAMAVDLGQTFTLQIPRFGWDAGRNFFCIGIIYAGKTKDTPETMTLVGWGRL